MSAGRIVRECIRIEIGLLLTIGKNSDMVLFGKIFSTNARFFIMNRAFSPVFVWLKMRNPEE
jgi:hypothetical protein